MWDAGRTPLVPHTLLSSRRHFLKAAPEGSRLSRTYAGFSGEGWGGLATAYLVQIVDEPD